MSVTPRNSPCPCGSGVKFKRCCLVRIERAASAQREHDRVGRDMSAWAWEEHGELLDRLLAPSWPDRWRYRGPLWEQLFGTWAISDADPGDGGPPLARRYAGRGDLEAGARDVARRIADARLDLLRVRRVVPGAWIELEPLRRRGNASDEPDGVKRRRRRRAGARTRHGRSSGAFVVGPVRTFPGADERKWRARIAAQHATPPEPALELLRFEPEDHAEPLPDGVELVSAEWVVEDDDLVCEDLAEAPGVQGLGLEIGGDGAWAYAWLASPETGAADLAGWDAGDGRIDAARLVVERHRVVVRTSAPALLSEIGAWLAVSVDGLVRHLAHAA